MLELDKVALQSQLMDIYQPDSVSWWPLAPGWWLLLLLSLAVVTIVARYRYQKTALRRASLYELGQIEEGYKQKQSLNQLAMTLNLLLRRILLSKTLLNFEPGLYGRQWLEYLDSHWERQEFSQGAGQNLLILPYQNYPKYARPSDEDNLLAKELIDLTRSWIRKVA